MHSLLDLSVRLIHLIILWSKSPIHEPGDDPFKADMLCYPIFFFSIQMTKELNLYILSVHLIICHFTFRMKPTSLKFENILVQLKGIISLALCLHSVEPT